MPNISLERLEFDPVNPADGPLVGSYIRAAGGDVITSTDVSGKKSLDVNVANSITVDVDLDHSTDSVALGDGTNLVTVTNVGADYGLDVNIINASIAVSATDLDIRDLTHVSDSVKIGDGTDFLAVNADGSINATVSATNLDIRDLAFASDSVTAHQGGSWSVAVNNFAPNTAIASAAVSVDTTAGGTAVPASALANRRYLTIQNNGDKSIFVGPSGVTASSGIEIAKGASMSFEAGPSVAYYAIAASGTVDVRAFEQS